MKSDEEIDCYCLENLNIIQLGNKLGTKMTREYYPKELIKRTQPMYVKVPSYFVEDSEFYNNLFDIICEGDESSSKEDLVEATLQLYRSNELFKKFAHSVLQLFACLRRR
ncbi:unnamed protein product [Mucor hiemalis]